MEETSMARGWKFNGHDGLTFLGWKVVPRSGDCWADIHTPAGTYAGSANGTPAIEQFVRWMKGRASEPQRDEWSAEPVARTGDLTAA
jgi:hypothetical protein